jgi:hypothetical protein
LQFGVAKFYTLAYDPTIEETLSLFHRQKRNLFLKSDPKDRYLEVCLGYEMFGFSIGNNGCNKLKKEKINKQSLMMVSNLLPFENNCNNELLMYVCHSNIICDDFSVEFN